MNPLIELARFCPLTERESPLSRSLVKGRRDTWPALVRQVIWACSPIFCVATVAFGAKPAIRFQDVTAASGIEFRHTDGSTGEHYIVEYVSAGLALFDYDNDGDVDIYFLNGAPPRHRSAPTPPSNALYRNEGDWTFTDVTKQAGVGDVHHGLGVTVGDYDNDGDADLYLNNYGPNVLLRNNGNGSFTDVTQAAGVGNGDRVGAGTCFLDMDADGDLDLYVANYIQFSYDKHVSRTLRGFPVYASPRDYSPEPDTLYRNNGDGTFTDVSRTSGIAAHAAYGMGMVCADYDRDGDTDVFVGNDTGANFLFRNDGHGNFEEVGLLTGFAYDGSGKIQGSMGVECGDFDNDGYLDFHATSYQNELSTLYRNLEGTLFEDVSRSSGAGLGTFPQVTWGNGLVDFDNDGDRDLFIACGHLYDNVDQFDDRSSYHATNLLYENLGRGKFSEISRQAGPGLNIRLSSRGAGFDDLDNDGDVDLVILNSRREPTLLRNDTPGGNHWIGLKLQGTVANRDGAGSRVEVITSESRQVDEVHRGRGYQSHYGSLVHFGLGQNATAVEVRVHWIGGDTEVWQDLPVDRVHTLTERRGGRRTD